MVLQPAIAIKTFHVKSVTVLPVSYETNEITGQVSGVNLLSSTMNSVSCATERAS